MMLAFTAPYCEAIAAQQPAFEVATIKLNQSGAIGGTLPTRSGNRLTATNISLQLLLMEAFKMQAFQISGPSWMRSETYDLSAKVEGNPTAGQMRAMFQQLLEERFSMKIRHEARELPLYSLAIDKGGLKMETAEGKDCPAPCGEFSVRKSGLLTGNGVTVDQLAYALSFVLGQTVLDKTGLNGKYNVNIHWTSDELIQEPGAASPSGTSEGPSLFSAMREKLGLRLGPGKGPVDTIVIDRAERIPAAN